MEALGLGGGNKEAAAQAAAQNAARQRQSLAELSRQQGEADQAGSSGGRKIGGRLLTFLSGAGKSSLG